MKPIPNPSPTSVSGRSNVSGDEICSTVDALKSCRITSTGHFAAQGAANTVFAPSEQIHDGVCAGDPQVIPVVTTEAKQGHFSPTCSSSVATSERPFPPFTPRRFPIGPSQSTRVQIPEMAVVSHGLRHDRAKEATPRFRRMSRSFSNLPPSQRSDWKSAGDPYGASRGEE